MTERETRDTASTTRSQSVVHFLERNHDDAARLLASLIERPGAPAATPGVLVVVPTPDDALALSEALNTHRRGEGPLLTPITSVARGRRLLEVGSPAVAGSPNELAPLIAESRLALGGLHTLVLVWPEEILGDARLSHLESMIAEVPRTAERVALCARKDAELTQFLERAMWRARTIDHAPAAAATSSTPVRLLAVAPADRVRALRAVLDAFDPDRTVLLTFSDEGEAAARAAASVMGAADGDALLHVSRGVPEGRFGLAVIFDDIPKDDALDAIGALANNVVAIIRPTRVASFRRIAGDVKPFVWSGAAAAARSAHDALRDEVRSAVASGAHLPWVPLVEPLLGDLDPVEVAASALAVLDRDRRRARGAAAAAAAAAPPQAPQAERPARESAARPGAKPFGRRPDDRGERPAFRRPDDRGERPGSRRPDERGERPFRKSGPGSFSGSRRPDDERGGPRRGASGPRREGRPRDDSRPPRGRDDARPGRPGRDEIERVPRAAREGAEWSERGDRLRHSKRGPRGGDAR